MLERISIDQELDEIGPDAAVVESRAPLRRRAVSSDAAALCAEIAEHRDEALAAGLDARTKGSIRRRLEQARALLVGEPRHDLRCSCPRSPGYDAHPSPTGRD